VEFAKLKIETMKVEQYLNTKNIVPAISLFLLTVISFNLFALFEFVFGYNPILSFLSSSYFSYPFMFLTTLLFVGRFEKIKFKQLFRYLGYTKSNFLKSVKWALFFGLLYLIIVLISISLFNLNLNTEFNKWYQTRFIRFYRPSFAFSVLFGAAFVEETAFRGYILTRLTPKGRLTLKKAILPILIAGIFHMMWHWPFGFYEPSYWGIVNNVGSILVGFVTGFIMLRTKNIFGASLFHIISDFL
jgi:membrane protease YdiL (CAAX protease family)